MFDLTVHHYSVDRDTGVPTQTRVTPYIRVRNGDAPPLFLRGGIVSAEDGKPISALEIPNWVWLALQDMSDATLREHGFDVDTVRAVDLENKEDTVKDVRRLPNRRGR